MHAVEKMMFTGKRPLWYGTAAQRDAVGVDLGENAVTSEVAIKAAGLDWDVLKLPAGVLDDRTTDVDGAPVWRPAPGHAFLARSTDGSILGRCTDEYRVVQNAAAFTFGDRLAREGAMLYHTAGSLDGGKRVWILAQTPHSWRVARRSGATNTHHAFIQMMLGHDGETGITLAGTDVRAECANTCAMAEGQAQRNALIIRIPHTGDPEAKMALAGEFLERLGHESDERRRVLQSLADEAMSTDEFIDFATSVFLGLDGEPEQIEEAIAKFYEGATDLKKTKMENRVADVARLFTRGIAAEGDSALDALNAWTEYFDHFDIDAVRSKVSRGVLAARAVRSSWVGAGAERKRLVYKRLLQRTRR